MLQRNMGRLDRSVRVLVGVALVPVGLFVLRGTQGNLVGIVLAFFAVLPILTGLTGFCPAYVPFGISTNGTRHQTGEDSRAASVAAEPPRTMEAVR